LIYESIVVQWYEIQKHIPANAYEICSGRLFISITYVNGFSLENAIISEFTSNEDLLHCCLASSMIPYVTAKSMYRIFRGRKTLDGGLTNNTPIFHDGVRRQLVFRLSEVRHKFE
jgi:predicted acylesterase/phospholipase RssA